MSFSPQQRIENLDEMVFQYLDVIFDLMENIMDMIEKRNKLIDEINISNL